MSSPKPLLSTFHERTPLTREVARWLDAGTPPQRTALEAEVYAVLDLVEVPREAPAVSDDGVMDAVDE